MITAVTSAVTTLTSSLLDVVDNFVANGNMLELIGLGIAFAILGYGISLLPRFRG